MSNLFQSNSYNVLGLDTSATQKEINKRAKEIINLLRIDEEPSYETDLNFITIDRQEKTVKGALQRLSSPTQRVKDYFFWFDIESNEDEKALHLIKEQKINEAVSLWKTQATKETANGFIAKKNLAILASLLLLKTGQKQYLTISVGCWKDVVLSDKFWSHFEKLYALNDDVGTNKSTIETFSKKVTEELSDFYTDTSELHKDRSFYALFAQVFGAKGERIQQNILSPIFEAINEASEKLEKLNISEDNIISDDEIATLKHLTSILKDNFDKLKELGLYNDSKSKTMRDKAAEALRTVALDLYNNLNEAQKPAALLSVAAKIAGTTHLQNQISKDVDQIQKNISNEKIIKPINDLLTDEKFAEALELIESQKEKYKNSKDLTEYFNSRMQWCITGMAARDFSECKKLFDKGKHKEASSQFFGLRDFILSYLDYFDFNRDAINEALSDIDNMLSRVNQTSTQNVDTYRTEVLEKSNRGNTEQFEDTILIILLDSTIYGNLARELPAIKRKSTIKSWIWWIVILIIIAVAASSNSSDNSNTGTNTGTSSGDSTSSAAYDTCSGEYDVLKSQLDSIEATMKSYEASGSTDSYNALVPKQNSLVNETNAKATECNNLR